MQKARIRAELSLAERAENQAGSTWCLSGLGLEQLKMLQVGTEVSGRAQQLTRHRTFSRASSLPHSHTVEPLGPLSTKTSPGFLFSRRKVPGNSFPSVLGRIFAGQDRTVHFSSSHALFESAGGEAAAGSTQGPLPFSPLLCFSSFPSGTEQGSCDCGAGPAQLLLAVPDLGAQPRPIPGDVGNALEIKSPKN